MKNIWKFEDIIDLEYFSNLDRLRENLQGEDLHRRDRKIFLEIERQRESCSTSHARCLAAWLKHRRLAETKGGRSFYPGRGLGESLRLFKWLLLVCGVLFGFTAGLSYFVYTGDTPLNVFTFFTIFILPQLGLIALLLLRGGLGRLTRQQRSFLQKVLVPLFQRFTAVLKKRILKHLGENQRKSVNLLFADKNSSLLTWPLFNQAQLFGIAFNLGLLLITLFKITTADLAFGWQTTLQVGAEGLSSVVQLIALPWSWLLPDEFSFPTLAQIEGSRIILKEGLHHLATEDLTSWWPFLLLSLLFYGLMPRLFLLLFGFLAERRNCGRFLDQRKFHAISKRMRTPLVTSQAAMEKSSDEEPVPTEKGGVEQKSQGKETAEHCLALIPDELFETLSDEELDCLLQPYGYQVRSKASLFRSYDEDQHLLTRMEEESNGVVVFIEAWMPPIHEHLLFLEELSQRLDGSLSLAICLLGKPQRDGSFSPLARDAALLWKEKILRHCDSAMVFEANAPKNEPEGQHQ